MPVRAIATIHVPSAMRPLWSRINSRKMRLALLRSTAEPTRRLAETPNRRPFPPRSTHTTMQRPARRRPFSRTSRRSGLERTKYFHRSARAALISTTHFWDRSQRVHAVSFFLPFLRLRLITARPALVLFRLRYPCLLLLHRLDG